MERKPIDDLQENNIRTEEQKVKRLPLTSDYVFKRIFAREENNSMLKDFLESILNIHINKVEVKNPELTPNMADEKLGILDLKLDIDNERVVDVEMQVSNEHNIKERSSTYLSKLAAEQLKVKQNYKELKKIITINILKYNYLESRCPAPASRSLGRPATGTSLPTPTTTASVWKSWRQIGRAHV